MKHSPLPWETHQEGHNVAGWPIWVVFTPESAVAKIYTYGEGDHPGRAEANAKLIVASVNNAQRFADALKYGSAIFDENNPNHEQAWEENADRGMTSEQVRAEAAQRLTAALTDWRAP